MIYGYVEQPSLRPGEQLALRVSTGSPAFRVEFYRCGAELVWMGASPWQDGYPAPHHLPDRDWGRPGAGPGGAQLPGWPGYAFDVPASWPPGVYLAVLAEAGRPHGPIRTPDARHGTALFVLRGRPDDAAPILYKLPLFTYHAYNEVRALPRDAPRRDTWCLYTGGAPAGVSVRRPGGGTGGTPWDIFNIDPFDSTPRQTFVHWDAPFIAWLERAGYRVDYCTDLDLHADSALLDRYRLLVSAGHDEYWSDVMRDTVERFVGAHGNVAFFGGNVCWWRVVVDEDGTFSRVQNWHDGPGRPENLLTGVSFRNGGERDFDDHPVPVGYRVQHADHWVYAGTGLGDGDGFGDRAGEYLVGYECDGAHFDRADLARGCPVRASGDDGTPLDFTILGVGDVAASGWGFGNRAATMGIYTRGGTVFTAATTDWSRVLARGTTPAVEQITRNVLDRLSGSPSGDRRLLPLADQVGRHEQGVHRGVPQALQ